MSRNELNRLLVASQEGDKESYSQFLSWGLQKATEVANYKVFNKDDCDDLVQEVLMGAHKNLHTFDPARDAQSWFMGILHKKLVDYFRKVTKISEGEIKTDNIDVTFEGDGMNTSIEALEVFEGIPESLIRPLVLTKIYGHSTKEASEILGIKENALRTRLSRSFKMIKDNIEKSLSEDIG